MRDHYDFSKGVRGKYTRPVHELKMPIYLDPLVEKGLEELAQTSGKEVESLVNALLTKDLELLKTVSGS